MSDIGKIIFVLFLIIIGLNFSANNTFISIMVNDVFFKDPISGKLIRLFGIIMALSSILIILNLTSICIYINVFIVFVLTFFSIRGRNKAMKEKLSAREQIVRAYEEEIKQKRQKIEDLRKSRLNTSDSNSNEAKSVNEIKKQMWDDGKMTNKDLIAGFNKDKK